MRCDVNANEDTLPITLSDDNDDDDGDKAMCILSHSRKRKSTLHFHDQSQITHRHIALLIRKLRNLYFSVAWEKVRRPLHKDD